MMTYAIISSAVRSVICLVRDVCHVPEEDRRFNCYGWWSTQHRLVFRKVDRGQRIGLLVAPKLTLVSWRGCYVETRPILVCAARRPA